MMDLTPDPSSVIQLLLSAGFVFNGHFFYKQKKVLCIPVQCNRSLAWFLASVKEMDSCEQHSLRIYRIQISISKAKIFCSRQNKRVKIAFVFHYLVTNLNKSLSYRFYRHFRLTRRSVFFYTRIFSKYY